MLCLPLPSKAADFDVGFGYYLELAIVADCPVGFVDAAESMGHSH